MTAQRIASLLASGTEILDGLGLGDRIVAISHECDFPADILDRPRVTHSHVDADAASGEIDGAVKQRFAAGEPLYSIDIDRLAELRPDLIVTQAQCEVCAVSYDDVVRAVRTRGELERCRIVALNPTSLDEVFQDIQRTADAAGVSEQGRAFVARLRSRVASVQERSTLLSENERPRVACIEWIDPIMLGANWMPDLIDLAGGRCELTASGVKSGYTKWEDVRAFDPEVVVVMPCGFDLERTLSECHVLKRLPGWSDLSAVKNKRAFAVDGNAYFNRSGPRLVDSLELLAAMLHPGLVSVTTMAHAVRLIEDA